MSMPNPRNYFQPCLSFPCYLILLCLGPLHSVAREIMVPIGVVLDLNSPIGIMANSCIWMAYHDFYTQNPRFQTRLDLRVRDSGRDAVTAAYAASNLTNEKVHAIIGPQSSGQARYVIELGRQQHVPIISFSATSPSLSPTRSHIFIRTAQDDCSQVKAIAAIVEAYGWREIVFIYEDTEYGNGLIPYLTDALEAVDTRVPYRSVIDPDSNERQILEELKKLKHDSTRIFLVHMTAERGSKLFLAAEKAGMMSEGYGWIITEGLSVILDPTIAEAMDSMQGVLGVRPKLNNTERLKDFKKRWKALQVKENVESHLTLFGLWAYDTVWALAMAVEAQILNSTHQKSNVTLLLNTILTTKFTGLSGYFNLTVGQLEPSVLEVFNVVGRKERVIGYWSPERGLFQEGQSNLARDREKLKQPIWPGDTTDQPPKMRIGVPVRRGFTEFLKLESRSPHNTAKFSGFVIDVFLEVLNVLNFSLSYEFIPLESSAYDDFLHQIKDGKIDAVVGDVTIVYYRTNFVDFTLPYSESGVLMVVSMKHDQRRNMWIFLKPLSYGLWLTTGAAFVLTGFVVWLLERRSNEDFRGTPDQQLGMIFWFSFSTLVFAHRERLVSNWSKFVLTVWVFVVLIITQSYTASLASLLTIESLQPAYIDIKEIKDNNYSVGYQNESFVKGLLIDQLGLSETQLKAYSTPEEYHEALSRGTMNGGVAAIFDESPYIKLFLNKYGSRYATVGPTYKTDGFGFAFPLNSSLVSYFTRAILNVTEDNDKFEGINNKYFSTGIVDQSASIAPDSDSLKVYSFAGLFIVTAVASLVSLLLYLFSFLYSQWSTLTTIHSQQTSFWSMVIETLKHFDRHESTSHPPMDRSDSRVHPVASTETHADFLAANGDSIDSLSTTNSHSEEDDVVNSE